MPSGCSCSTPGIPPCGPTFSSPPARGSIGRESISVSVTIGYRAIYVVRNNGNVWYWIGTHADYDKFTGRK